MMRCEEEQFCRDAPALLRKAATITCLSSTQESRPNNDVAGDIAFPGWIGLECRGTDGPAHKASVCGFGHLKVAPTRARDWRLLSEFGRRDSCRLGRLER